MSLKDTVSKIFGLDNEIKTAVPNIKEKMSSIYGTDRNTQKSNTQSYNPFINKDGTLFNPLINYQQLLDDDRTNDKVKSWIQEATGKKPSVLGDGYTQHTEQSGIDPNFSFNANADEGSLASLDVKTELPKLSTSQISAIISKYFPKSTVIKPSDAQGIYDAQTQTGMSALAILGIGALESGYGTSNIAKQKNNIWGWNATNVNPGGNASSFSQMSQGALEYAKNYMNTYYNKYGAKSIYQAGTGNNPAGLGYAYYDNGSINPTWATQVGDIMKNFYQTAKTVSPSSGTSSRRTLGLSANRLSSGTQSSNKIVNAAQKYIGTPYVWGGESAEEGGMDCSGFVYRTLKDAGYNVGRDTAEGYRSQGTRVSKENLQPGDLVFFGNGSASHIGVYMGNGQMIHSSGGSKNTASNPGKGVEIRNIDYRSDFIEGRRY